jgi:hypothetical protein
MEETFYEMLERTRAVDRLLFWLALLGPLVVAGLAAVLREHRAVTRFRHRWVLALLAAPALLMLWKAYNAVISHFGLDSVAGLMVNVAVFAAAALIAAACRIVLKVVFASLPAGAHARILTGGPPADAETVPFQEFRPYKPGVTGEAEEPASAQAPIKAKAAGDWGRKDPASDG